MAITTFSAVKNRVLGYTKASSDILSSELLEDLMIAAEFRIWAALKVPEMRSFLSLTYAAGGHDVSEFDSGHILRVSSVVVDVDSTTRWTLGEAAEDILRQWMIENDTDSPRVYGFLAETDGTNKFAIGPEPTGKTVGVSYYRKYDPLSTAVNAVFTKYPHIWLAALLVESFLYLKEMDSFQIWEAKLGDFINLANELGKGQTENHFDGPVGPVHSRTARP